MTLCILVASAEEPLRAEGAETAKGNSANRVEFHVSVSGNDANADPEASPFKTISQAGKEAQPGDVMVLVQTTRTLGVIILTAESDFLKPTFTTLTIK